MHRAATGLRARQGEITSGEILRAVEGELTAILSVWRRRWTAPHRSQCHTLDFWSGLNDLINKHVDGITLEQLRTMPEVPEEQESCESKHARAAEPLALTKPPPRLSKINRRGGGFIAYCVTSITD